MIPPHWPKWMLFFIAFGAALAIIVAGLILEPIGLALSPTITPESELPVINYARPLSLECEACHFDPQALLDSGAAPEALDALTIERTSLETPHGSLGCVTCHDGTPGTADKDAAHEGLNLDLAVTHPQDCVLCHRDLPDEIPEDHMRTPHGTITNAVWEGSACGVQCIDCHGQVGHGFDPVTGSNICPMSVCQDCHQTKNMEASLTQCSTCHVGPHTLPDETTACETCHASTEGWHEIALAEHEVELTGKHGELDCFACHRWPNFSGLEATCSNCHTRTHEQGNDNCAVCHSPDGWDTSVGLLLALAMDAPHPSEGVEACRDCHGLEGENATPDGHQEMTEDTCQACHAPQSAPAIQHPVEQREACLECHATNALAPYPSGSHATYEEDICGTCHQPSGLEPPAVTHTLERRRECAACHGPVRPFPFPASHAGRGEELCLACHTAEDVPTAMLHLFPIDHSGASENCELCHNDFRFETFSCETCHSGDTIRVIHDERGIKLEEDCTICHPQGKKPQPGG